MPSRVALFGILSEPALNVVRSALIDLGIEPISLNQREAFWWQLVLDDRGDDGVLNRREAEPVRLSDISGIYTRPMDPRALARAEGREAEAPRLIDLHRSLGVWLELTAARVVNRPSAMAANSSKPYQAQLISNAGFRVPRTLITNDPSVAREFIAEVGPVVYKSISSHRSVVQRLDVARSADLDTIRWCPTQFQEFLPGDNIRVHVIGNETIATGIRSKAVDYRYANRYGEKAYMSPMQLDTDLKKSCVALARALELGVAGIDIRLDAKGDPYCLEVNPMPAFTYFQDRTGQQIGAMIAQYVAERNQ
jgi:hypothetical protein